MYDVAAFASHLYILAKFLHPRSFLLRLQDYFLETFVSELLGAVRLGEYSTFLPFHFPPLFLSLSLVLSFHYRPSALLFTIIPRYSARDFSSRPGRNVEGRIRSSINSSRSETLKDNNDRAGGALARSPKNDGEITSCSAFAVSPRASARARALWEELIKPATKTTSKGREEEEDASVAGNVEGWIL